MDLGEHVRQLLDDADRTNQRRLLVLAGERDEARTLFESTFGETGRSFDGWVAIGRGPTDMEHIDHHQSHDLLGRTIDGLWIDATDGLYPNSIGQSIGAVDGGGLIVLAIGSPDSWVEATLASDADAAVYPHDPEDVSTRFRRRFFQTLLNHSGISFYDIDTATLRRDGTVDVPHHPSMERHITADSDLLDHCLTGDQRRCVRALLDLKTGSDVLVVEAHRGRGKSSAAGIAAAAFVRQGTDVLITGPGFTAVSEAFDRASTILGVDVTRSGRFRTIDLDDGGSFTYRPPASITTGSGDADIIVVDEAAALPVDTLKALLSQGRPITYLTTVHGYEGTGRGFAVRFHDALDASDRHWDRFVLREPIRYAIADPIETWQFHALLLDASPPPDQVVDGASPSTTTYRRIDRDELVRDDALLNAMFGLLVVAHYRTEPADLFRLLDAPNISIRALIHDGFPVSVALLAREGSLPTSLREDLYQGESIRGHMVPDLLTTQLRDRDAGALSGVRVLRIATHRHVRSRGLGSALLRAIEDEVGPSIDWLGAGFGMSPALVSFWRSNGYSLVHLSTGRNPRSGEHSAVFLRPTSDRGANLVDRHGRRLLDRLPGQLTDALRDLEPVILYEACRSIDHSASVDGPSWMWDVMRHAPNGPGQVAVYPDAFRQLAMAGLVNGPPDLLDDVQRFLVIRRILQSHEWDSIGAEVPTLTRGDARRCLNQAIGSLLTWWDNVSQNNRES